MKPRPRNLGRFRRFGVFAVLCIKRVHGKRFATNVIETAIDAGTNRTRSVIHSVGRVPVIRSSKRLCCGGINNSRFPRTKDAAMIGWIVVAFAGQIECDAAAANHCQHEANKKQGSRWLMMHGGGNPVEDPPTTDLHSFLSSTAAAKDLEGFNKNFLIRIGYHGVVPNQLHEIGFHQIPTRTRQRGIYLSIEIPRLRVRFGKPGSYFGRARNVGLLIVAFRSAKAADSLLSRSERRL